ncbi:MAG: hypothetical protein LBV37_01330 [Mycoplasmataceae bacterium]|jgi:hypothetical protein|nr:hypothetical protein [Mycoplasmataceae bacterium]
MKKVKLLKLLAPIGAVLFTGTAAGVSANCSSNNVSTVALSEVKQVGGSEEYVQTTALEFTVSGGKSIGSLTADNVKITGDDALTKGDVTDNTGGKYTIIISNITSNNEKIAVEIINVSGHKVTGTKDVNVYRDRISINLENPTNLDDNDHTYGISLTINGGKYIGELTKENMSITGDDALEIHSVVYERDNTYTVILCPSKNTTLNVKIINVIGYVDSNTASVAVKEH